MAKCKRRFKFPDEVEQEAPPAEEVKAAGNDSN